VPTRHFHRFDSEGQPYFVTAVTFDRRPIFRSAPVAELFIEVLYKTRAKYGFLLLGFVVMPDHVHVLVLPHRRNRISDVARFIKGTFARAYNIGIGGSGSVWQRSFYERMIRNEAALREVLAYIDENPVVGGLAEEPSQYAFGSASGRYETDLISYLGG